MGMAASQARFLGLTARKSNVEFEGQQINQQRTALSNQSANYYSELLGMSVPTPPSVDSFTKTVYTFEDGALTNEITALIAQNNGTYTLSYLSKWQDDYIPVAASSSIINVQNGVYYVGAKSLRQLGTLNSTAVVGNTINVDGKNYPVSKDNNGYFINKTSSVKSLKLCTDKEIANFEYYQFDGSYKNATQLYKDEQNGGFYSLDEQGNKSAVNADENSLIICLYDDTQPTPDLAVTLVTKNADGTYSKEIYEDVTEKVYLTDSQIKSITSYPEVDNDERFKGLSNSEIQKALDEEKAWIQQLEQKYGTADWYVRYETDTSSGAKIPYFYKKSDIDNNKNAIDEYGNILSNINCYKIGSAQKVEEVKAITGCHVERDSSGRFISIHIPNGNNYTEYALTTTTVTDQDAFDDAMNEYEYQKYLYDQAIESINAKIEIVQSEDKNLELRLKQLDTEQDAIQTEMDSVSKVIEKNTESTFKTFG